jgi:flavin-dependent dehydrogenase
MPDVPECFDVIVVGGGPAGAGAAGLLAMEGHRVLLLEKDKFPRYHIGESLITGIWPTLDRLGLRPRLEQIGFVRKYGATVRWGGEGDQWGFAFRDAGRHEYALQVPRAEFDALLLGRARELGVHVVEDATVREPVFDGDRLVGVRYEIRGEQEGIDARARITVDASGQRRWLGSHLGLVQWHDDLRNVAVWSYYQGCLRYEGERAGHTLVEMRRGGWLWFIPLDDDITSIGYVTPAALLAEAGAQVEEVFATQLERSREVKPMMRGAKRVAAYRTARDWSYACTRFFGPGWVLVGDAAAFVDPLLSTGVTLALRGARVLAPAVSQALADPSAEAEALRSYEESSRKFFDVILDFVLFFYDQTRTRPEYYQGAQEIIDPDGRRPPRIDFVKLVSGLACEDDDVDVSDILQPGDSTLARMP